MTVHRTVSGGQDVAANILAHLDREADSLRVSFYVENREEGSKEPVVFAAGAPTLPPDALTRLRDFAEERAVTIYVHPSLFTEHSDHGIITGRSSND